MLVGAFGKSKRENTVPDITGGKCVHNFYRHRGDMAHNVPVEIADARLAVGDAYPGAGHLRGVAKGLFRIQARQEIIQSLPGEGDVGGALERLRLNRRLAVEDAGNSALARDRQRLHGQRRPAIVGQHRIHLRRPVQPAGIVAQAPAAEIHDLALAGAIDIDGGKGRQSARRAVDKGDIDALLHQPGDDEIADRIGAQTCRQQRLATLAGHSDSGVGGASAANDGGILGTVFLRRGGHVRHQKDEVRDRDTGQKDAGHPSPIVAGASGPAHRIRLAPSPDLQQDIVNGELCQMGGIDNGRVVLSFVISRLEAVITFLLRIGRFVAWISIGLMVVVILVQVFFRYVLNAALPWPDEAARFLMLWMTGLIAPSAYRWGGFVSIDMLKDMLGRRAGIVFNLVILVISFCVLVVALQLGWKHVKSGWLFNSGSLRLPLDLVGGESVRVKLAWMYMSVYVGFWLMTAVNVEMILKNLHMLLDRDVDYGDVPDQIVLSAE